MNKLRPLLCLFVFLNSSLSIGQVTLSVTVNSGSSGTNCTDGFLGGGPEEHWQVNIAGQGNTTYPAAGICFTNTPNVQYSEVFNCNSTYPNLLQVCFTALENDGAACIITADCSETTCQTFAVPAPGGSSTYTLAIPNTIGNDSWGSVNFTITATGSFLNNGNDNICNAINLGTLNSNDTIGDNTLSNYNNFCGTNAFDPSPTWTNDQGVWFQFTTGANPSAITEISAASDPQGIGNSIDLQLAVFESSNNFCTGVVTQVQSSYTPFVYNETLNLNCLAPNTTYFILVDGEGIAPVEGYFGLEVIDDGNTQVGDEICDAENLGSIPNGGSVGTSTLSQNNTCATNTNDPVVNGVSNQGVWYQIQAPASGHIDIDANSDLPFPLGTDAVDLQLALFETDDNLCTGNLNMLDFSYTAGLFDEDMTTGCLTPNQNYWILVDGSNSNPDGVFDLTISDAGTVATVDATIDVQTACDTYTWIDGNTYTADNNTATFTLTNVTGCDSVVTLDLTINNSTAGTAVITACDTYTWIDGNTYTASNNTATFTLTNAAGCDSVVTLDLIINNSTTGTDIITACDTYTWIDGNTYTANNNTATFTLTNAAGCDSVVTLNLTILPVINTTATISACNTYTWVDGNTYTTNNNTASVTLTSLQGCDSIVTLDLTINTPNTGTAVITACDTYTWIDGNTYTTDNNTATFTLTNAAGCDSVVTLNLTINNSTTGTDLVTACDTYTWIDGNTYTTNNTTATHTLTNATGCDSIVTLNLTILNSTTGVDIESACNTYTWIDGNTYTTDNNTATFTLTNAAGCDSVVTLNLTILPVINTTATISACNTYTWVDGNTYTTNNNTASVTLTSLQGCDSIVTLDLTINTPNTGTDIITACDTYTWIDGNTYTADNNIATFTLTNSAGCDSIVTLDLTINNSTTGTDVITACGTYTWIDGNTYTNDNNTATITLTSATGCDSVVTLDLTINSPTTGTDVITACDTYTWIDGNTYTTSNNTATFTLTNALGCDSVVTLNLTIDNATTGTDVITACDTYTWIDGNTYTASNNTATFTLANTIGCDSVVTLDLTINNSTTGTDIITACDTYTWIDGNTYTTDNNTATFTLTNSTGCDSVVTLDLTINNSTTGTDIITACDTYTWIDGNTYTNNNSTATVTLTSTTGCDSVVTLDLTINNSTTGTDVITACDTYTWIDGNTYTNDNNTATFTLTNVVGCDSVVTLNLTINNSTTGTDLITACDTYTWIDGNTYTISNNTATHTLINAVGCDSVVTLDLTILNQSLVVDVIKACDSYTWLNGETYYEDNYTATHTLTNTAGCDSVILLNLNIKNTAYGTDVIESKDSYVWLNGKTYLISNNTDTMVLANSAKNGCDSIVTLDLTIYHEEDIRLYVPNAFTPNSGFANSEWQFYIDGIDIYNFNIKIFNRWGEIVWESHDPSATWDGKFNNHFVDDGVYVWVMNFTGQYTDEKHQHTGYVTVIK